MRRAHAILGLVLASLLAGSAMPAAAQGDQSAGFQFGELDGIVAAVGRTWSIDFATIRAEASPVVGEEVFPGPEGLLFMFGWALEFDGDDHAAAAFTGFVDNGPDLITGEMEIGELEIEGANLPGVGDQGYAFDVQSLAEGNEGYFRYTLAQKGAFVLFAISLATTPEKTAAADDLLGYMVNDGAKGDDAPAFNDAGGSTGGLWGFFPALGDASLGGLVLTGDQVYYPAPEGNDESALPPPSGR